MAEYIPNFNNVNGKAIFQESATRANLTSGENIAVSFGKIKKWFSDLQPAAFTEIDSAGPTASSTKLITSGDVYAVLTPISESAYAGLTTKDKPLYFIYPDS